MKILITGFVGFIGYFLSKKLSKKNNFRVVGIDNLNNYYDTNLKKSRFDLLKSSIDAYYFFDISNMKKLKETISKERPDIIIHLAAQAGVRYSLEKPEQYFKSNLKGFFNIIECCRIYNIKKLFFASSSSVYGNNKNHYFSEDDFVDNPLNLYAASKKSNELMAYSYSHLYNIKSVGLRFFTVYGPLGRPDMSYYKFTNDILNGKTINVHGKGEMFRDFTYIDDIINGITMLMGVDEKKLFNKDVSFNIFNIGNNQPIKLSYFIELIEKTLGIRGKKKLLDFQIGEAIKTSADISKIQSITNYNPTVKIEDGLPMFINWFKKYNDI